MKTASNANLKDNVAAATLLAATFIAIVGSFVTSHDARADKTPQVQMQKMEVQKMEPILITAPRIKQVTRMETIIVTASRHTDEAAKFLDASDEGLMVGSLRSNQKFCCVVGVTRCSDNDRLHSGNLLYARCSDEDGFHFLYFHFLHLYLRCFVGARIVTRDKATYDRDESRCQ